MKMPKRQQFEENKYYHIYNRGRYKQTLFHDWKDYQRFLGYISTYKEKCKDDLGIVAYCILPNHFHFVLHNKSSSHKISYFIGNICASYTRYHKAKYTANKGVNFFESRFKAKLLDNQEYLDQCIHYVEFNPVKHALTDNIENRLFTSYDKNSKKTSPNQEILALDWEFV